MKDNDVWINSILLGVIGFVTGIVCINIGFDAGEISGRKKGIIYCMEQPEKCKIEYQYLKLTEKTK
jgi:hypothetical protein